VSNENDLLKLLRQIGQPPENDAPAVADASNVVPKLQTKEGPDVPEIPAPTEKAVSRKNLFVHYDTHPLVFDIVLLQRYQEDWLAWEPETLWQEIMADFRVPSISDHSRSKIQAVRTLHINEWFWTKWEVCGWITQVLNYNLPDWQVLQQPTLSQLMVGVEIASFVRGDEQFVEDVPRFMAASLIGDDVFYAPPPLLFCQPEINRLLERGQSGVIQLLPEIEQRWRALSKMPIDQALGVALHETPVDTQLARLLVARDYQELRRRQLREQLQVLQ
jgi:hypothetical protein